MRMTWLEIATAAACIIAMIFACVGLSRWAATAPMSVATSARQATQSRPRKLREGRWYDYGVGLVWVALPLVQWNLFLAQPKVSSFLIPLMFASLAMLAKYALTPPDIDLSAMNISDKAKTVVVLTLIVTALWFAPRSGAGSLMIGLLTDIVAIIVLGMIKVLVCRRSKLTSS